MADYLLLQAVLIPILASPIAYLIGSRFGSKVTVWFSFVILLYSTLALLAAASTSNPISESYRWFPSELTGSGLLSSIGTFGLYLDGISIPFALTIYIICTAVTLYSFPYMKHRILEQEREARKPERVDAIGDETKKPPASPTEMNSRGIWNGFYDCSSLASPF